MVCAHAESSACSSTGSRLGISHLLKCFQLELGRKKPHVSALSDGQRRVLWFSNYLQDRQRNLFIHKIKILTFLLSIFLRKGKLKKMIYRK